MPTQQRHTPAARPSSPEQLGETALTAFFNIATRWGLGPDEERILLGNPPRSTFYKWKKTRRSQLSPDTLERISYVLGIYKALHILLPRGQADEWIRKPNRAPLFNGQSALEKMTVGRVVDLADVRRYLDAERG